jgi:prepilin-type N-terminal cleavage/methylation domain-containing protein
MPNSLFQFREWVDAFPLAPGSAGVLPGCGGTTTPAKRAANGKNAYTLIEVLVVVVVIVLMLGMALPVFRAITGSRSEAGATNIIASMLGRARDDAIGLQQPYGVAFIYNPATQVSYLAEVYFPTPVMGFPLAVSVPPGGYFTYMPAGQNFYSYYINSTYPPVTMTFTGGNFNGATPLVGPALDLVPDTDLVPLPAGVGVATICNCTYSGTTRVSNGYLSVGVILFDGKGRITSMPYGISKDGKLWTAAGLGSAYPSLGFGLPSNSTVGVYNSSNVMITQGVNSQFGLVVFQRDAWLSNRSSQQPEALYTDGGNVTSLPDYTNGSPTQQQTDNWLDQNATPLLIDRYTGTLIRGE